MSCLGADPDPPLPPSPPPIRPSNLPGMSRVIVYALFNPIKASQVHFEWESPPPLLFFPLLFLILLLISPSSEINIS